MNNKSKYVNEIINLDVSMTVKYYDRLEELISNYLKKDFVVMVSDIILMDPIVKDLLPKCELFSFREDANFKEIDSGFVVSSDNKNIVEQIREMTNKNLDYRMDSVMVAMAIADAEDILKNT